MPENKPEDSDEARLLALAKYLETMRDDLVRVSLLLQDGLFELETERQALQCQHADSLLAKFVREHDVSASKSSRDLVAEACSLSQPVRSSCPSKPPGTEAS